MDDAEEEMSVSFSGSSPGEAVSGRGQSPTGEDDDLYYIPERRPSLDLGPHSMDISSREQALPPIQSYNSMTSEDTDRMESEDESYTRIQLYRTGSFSSCYSYDSDDCEKRIPKVKPQEQDASESMDNGESGEVEITDANKVFESPNEFAHPSLNVLFTFNVLFNTFKKLPKTELSQFKTKLWNRYPDLFITSPQHVDLVDLVDRLLERYKLEEALQITKVFLVEMQLTSVVDSLQKECLFNEVRYELREILRKKYGESDVGGEKRPFDEIYTDLFLSAYSDNGPNIEHEVMTIKKLSTNKEENKLLPLKDTHAAESANSYDFKFVLLSGVAGSGKSTLVQRFILDWTEGRSHQDLTFLFPISFRELKQFKDVEVSLVSILNELYPPTKKIKFEEFTAKYCKLMLVFDGLDEYEDKLDFFNTELYGAFLEPTTLNILVVNMLRGRLLYHGQYLVTTRSQVQCNLPLDVYFREIQLQGFSDAMKDEYFKKRFKDEVQAARVISHVKSSKTLHIMCHLPLFCSLVAEECQQVFAERGSQAALPRSLTYMYTKLMLVLVRDRRSLRVPGRSAEEERDFLMNVGKLAFSMVEEGSFTVNKSYDWEPHGVNDKEAVDYSGIGTEFSIKPQILYKEKVFSFIHPTMQEYMAALYVFLSFTNQGKNIFENHKNPFKSIFKGPKLMDVYKSAVDRSLQCEDGKLDIFLRFLFGMLVKTNLELLKRFCNMPLEGATDAAALIKKKMRDASNQHPDRMRNLQHCLEELGV